MLGRLCSLCCNVNTTGLLDKAQHVKEEKVGLVDSNASWLTRIAVVACCVLVDCAMIEKMKASKVRESKRGSKWRVGLAVGRRVFQGDVAQG